MQAYKVVGKAHRRVTQVRQTVMTTDGQKFEMIQNGPLVIYQVGDVLEDITADELTAHPDRFQPATAAEIDAFRAKQAAAQMVMQAPGFTTAQAEEHAALERQIQELLAKQRGLVETAETPVPVEVTSPRPSERGVSEPVLPPDPPQVTEEEVVEPHRVRGRH